MTAQVAAQSVSTMIESLFADIDLLRTQVERDLATATPRRTDLSIEGLCLELLTNPDGHAAGAGVVMAPGVLEDATYWLEWWTCDPDSDPRQPRRLAANTDPRSVGFRDYTQLPWYVEPFTTGRPSLAGPYIDYLCTDEQALTLTTPVQVQGAFGGVVGFDVLVRTVEQVIYPQLQGIGRPSVLANRAGRVVTSSHPALLTGDLIRGLPAGWWTGATPAPAGWDVVGCGDIPLGILVSTETD